jgi:NADPH:quinone reductase-like Zn-dependent oxidoreductase
MRALVVEQPGGPEAMRVRQLPAPQPGPDQVVVAVDAALVGSIVELAGDLELAVDRNITLHGVLMRPSRQVLGVLAAAVAGGSLRPVVDQVLDLAKRPRPTGGSSPGAARARWS